MYQDRPKSLYALQIGRSHVVELTIRSKISQGTLQNERSHVVNPQHKYAKTFQIPQTGLFLCLVIFYDLLYIIVFPNKKLSKITFICTAVKK